MHRFKFFLALALLAGSAWFFNTYQPFGLQFPAVGKLFDPFSGFWRNAEPVSPEPPGSIVLPGLEAEVTVVMDERLVPHIFADNWRDALYVQGYLTAKYRLWQMDLTARATSGRLSEVLGAVVLDRDRSMRRQGLLRGAENVLADWKESSLDMEMAQAFADGANAYIENLSPSDYPLEFKLLGYAPEPWSPLKSALCLQSMAHTLCSRNDDLEATNTLALLGQDLFDFLFPEDNPRQAPVIPGEVEWNFSALPVSDTDQSPAMIGESLSHRPLEKPSPFIGSNNWAISGRKTASGKPILCNDPHLDLTLPSVWFEQQIHLPDVNAYGVTLPGVPGIIIGFNEFAAWGATNVGQDVLDWYRIDWESESRQRYRLDGAWLDVEEAVEIIRVKGRRDPVIDTVKYTVWGPVVYESPESPYQDLAMRWLAHDRQGEKSFHALGAIRGLMVSKSHEDYLTAIKGFDAPALNMVFADREGDIGMAVNGKFPLKAPQQGRFIQDGSRSSNAWKGFIPREHLPVAINPKQGYVASANQHSTDYSYPYYYNGHFEDYRGRMVNRLLAGRDSLAIEDMMNFQNDSYSIKAEEALPLLRALLPEDSIDEQGRKALQMLEQWDFRYFAESKAPIIFEEWFENSRKLTFDELFGVRDSMAALIPEAWRFIELLRDHPDHPVFDIKNTPSIETAREVAGAAFKQALAAMVEKLGDPGFDWAAYRGNPFKHLGRVEALGANNVKVGGSSDALNAVGKRSGPSWRMIVELGDEPRAFGVYPGGQSGNPGSKHYDQMIAQWAAGKYYELFLMKNPEDRRREINYTVLFKK